MYSITNISAHNFMSFEDVSYSFENKCYVVKGENRDNEGQQSNGSGKTSLLEVIAVTLLGQSLTDRDLKQCVNRYGEHNYFITAVLLANEKQSVRISRKVYSNTKSQELSIDVDGNPVTVLPTKAGVENGVDLRKGNEWILNDLFDISKEDLLNYFLISDKYYKGFLNSNNQDKINVISRFSNADRVDRAIGKLEERFGKVESELTVCENESRYINGQLEGLLSSVSVEAKRKFEEDKEKQKQQLLPRIKELEAQSEKLSEKLSELGRAQFECEEFYGRNNEQKLAELKEQKKETDFLIDSVESLIAKITTQLKGKITCPACNHEFVIDCEHSVEELNKEIEEASGDLEALKKDGDELKDMIAGDRFLKEIEDDMARYAAQNGSLVKTYESLCKQIESIESQQFAPLDIADKRKQLEKKGSDNAQSYVVLQKEQQQLQDWIERFERFKYFLINKPVAIICHQTNQILKEIGCDYTVSIEGFKKLKSGELRAELTPIIHIRGVESQPYAGFSAGERTRLDLACGTAIQNMINATSKGGLNFYFSDEKISALDSKGIEGVAKSFNRLGKTMLLVSHSGSDLNYANQIIVKKENRKSILI